MASEATALSVTLQAHCTQYITIGDEFHLYLLIFIDLDLERVYTMGIILKGVSEDEAFNEFSRGVGDRHFCDHRMRYGREPE